MIGKALVAVLSALPMCAPTAPPRPALDVVAFCGVNPDDPFAWEQAYSLAHDSGVDVTYGPCLLPPANYSPAWPGSRFATPEQYLDLVVINANQGMRTIVYDARIWGSDTERAQAVAFWSPHLAWIYAWDMGDEFMPGTADWRELVTRWRLVRSTVEPATGIGPLVNHVGDLGVVEQGLVDFPGTEIQVSFDLYSGDAGVTLARSLDAKVRHLGCAVNAVEHMTFSPSPTSVQWMMIALRDAGCDYILIFGGAPIDAPGLDRPSLVSHTGTPTPLAHAVLDGAR